MRLDQFTERDRHLFFNVARLVDVTGDAEQLRAGIVGTAEARKPLRAAAQDGRHNGDRLHVVHRRRATIEACVGREWRLQAWLALLAFEAFEQRRFLAADIGPGAVVDVKVEVPTIDVVLADQLGFIRLLHRLLERVALRDVFAANIDIALVGAHRAARHHAAFNQQVRIMAHDLAILAGAGLGLVGVDDQIVRTITHFLGHEGPLQAGGEAGAAAPAQARRLDLVAQPVGALIKHFLRQVPRAPALRRLEIGRVKTIEVGEDAILVLQHLRRLSWVRNLGGSEERKFGPGCRRTAPDRSTRSYRLPARC